MDFPLAVLCEKYLLPIVDEFSSFQLLNSRSKQKTHQFCIFLYKVSVFCGIMILPTF